MDTDGVRHCIDQIRVNIGFALWSARVLLCILVEIGIDSGLFGLPTRFSALFRDLGL